MYKAVKLEAFWDFAERHGNMNGNVLKYAIKQQKGSLEIYTLKSSFCIPQLFGTFSWTDSRTTAEPSSSFKTPP